MKYALKILPWKRALIVSIVTLSLLIISSFYGLYTNQFYFFKFQNYIFPLAALVHFAFLYVLWFKITEEEIADPQMRNLEYVLYAIVLVYIYKLVDTIIIVTAASSKFVDHSIAETFQPIGILIMILYTLLIILTVVTIRYRIEYVGGYKFDDMDQIDKWD